MRKLMALALFAGLLAGCGEQTAADPPRATPQATGLEGYTQGVKDYYRDVHGESTGDDVEAEYHQPPRPAAAGLGEPITLTGTNIGIRMRVTVTKVESVSSFTAVGLELENTGITNYEAPLRNAALTNSGGGAPEPVADGARAKCSNGFDADTLFIEVGASKAGCLLFRRAAGATPERLQLALEIVPTEAGGIWNLR